MLSHINYIFQPLENTSPGKNLHETLPINSKNSNLYARRIKSMEARVVSFRRAGHSFSSKLFANNLRHFFPSFALLSLASTQDGGGRNSCRGVRERCGRCLREAKPIFHVARSRRLLFLLLSSGRCERRPEGAGAKRF